MDHVQVPPMSDSEWLERVYAMIGTRDFSAWFLRFQVRSSTITKDQALEDLRAMLHVDKRPARR